MSNKYEVIDINSWKRKIHCQIFRNAVQPQYCISVELDVTNFHKVVKEREMSYTLSFIFAVTKCANEIKEFRYRFLDDKVIIYESIDTSFTYMDKDEELFKVVNVPMCDSIEEYLENAAEIISNQREYFTGPIARDVYQFSALPWVAFTHVSHTESGQKDKAQPMFDWGKFYEKDGKLVMPFSIQVHHSFVDGIHIGKLVDKIQKYLDEI